MGARMGAPFVLSYKTTKAVLHVQPLTVIPQYIRMLGKKD